jgi:hypothetical protein
VGSKRILKFAVTMIGFAALRSWTVYHSGWMKKNLPWKWQVAVPAVAVGVRVGFCIRKLSKA